MNNKGHIYLLGLIATPSWLATSVIVVSAFKIAFLSIALAAIWHIPAWEQAKDTHTESIYQAQQMWPQQLFNKIPNTGITYLNGNGGNFVGGIDK